MSLFYYMIPVLKLAFLEFLDTETKQNLFIYFNRDFYNCYFNSALTKLKKMVNLDNIKLDKKIIKINDLDKDVRKIFCLTQSTLFENLLFEVQNLLFSLNKPLYNKVGNLIHDYYIAKLLNPYINTIFKNEDIKDNNFTLINVQTFNWLINNIKFSDFLKYSELKISINKIQNKQLDLEIFQNTYFY